MNKGQKVNQKEAVFAAVTSVMKNSGIRHEPGMNVSKVLTREHRAQVNVILFQGFKSGTIELATPFADDAELKSYVSGLQSNWLRKDTRLNGGDKYVPKNIGIRTGSGDAQLKALRSLLGTVTNPAERAEIQKYIDKRVSELTAAKKHVDINYSALPAELARKYA